MKDTRTSRELSKLVLEILCVQSSHSHLGWLHDQTPDGARPPCSDRHRGGWKHRPPSSHCCRLCCVDACGCVRRRCHPRLAAMRQERRRGAEERMIGRPSRVFRERWDELKITRLQCLWATWTHNLITLRQSKLQQAPRGALPVDWRSEDFIDYFPLHISTGKIFTCVLYSKDVSEASLPGNVREKCVFTIYFSKYWRRLEDLYCSLHILKRHW